MDENEKIARLRERQAAVEAEQSARNAERKVIVLRTKEVFVPTDEAPQEAAQEAVEAALLPEEPKVDEEAVEALEDALEQAKKGGVSGVVILLGLPTLTGDDVVTDVSMISTGAVMDNIQIFVGGLETAKADLLKTHEDIYWGPEDDE